MATPPPEPRMTVSAPPSKPLLIFDGECTFCRLWIERWRAHTLDAVDYAESRQVAGHFREIPVEIYDRTVVLVLPDGSVRTGAEAVLRSRAMGRRGTWILALYEKAAWFRATAETLYRFVAEHRQAASRWTRLLWGTHPAPPTYARSSALYLRLLGAVYLLAFVSLWLQIDGLIGNRGILPFASYLDAARAQLGLARFWRIPTLAWISPDDTFLHLLCAAGVLSSLLVSLGLVPLLGLALCWALYLSLATVSGTFLNFQWDYLLLEAGFLSIFMAPLSWRTGAGRNVPPGRLARSLVSWLVFRLMLGSGIVKLSSGDPTWWHLRALDVHFETQPLPPWTAWYAHHLPHWFHTMSVLMVFTIELVVPFCVLAPRRLRHIGVGLICFLQVCIAATGNYGFFNLLSAVLLVPLIDDAAWPRRWRRVPPPGSDRRWPGWIVVPVAVLLYTLGTVNLVNAFRVSVPWPSWIQTLRHTAGPLRSANGYGLFAVMTTRRPEIIVEGSLDGSEWRTYEFRWKPGDIGRRPRFTGPHMPRLDWQMWFAALGDYRSNRWFLQFQRRLLEGSPEVLALLATNPFPDKPPRFVRAVLYDYHFTDAGAPGARSTWWRRRRLGPYSPTLQLRGARESP